MRVFAGKSFTTIDTFRGLLPFLPPPAKIDKHEEESLFQQVANEPQHFTQPDTYNEHKTCH
jgi:hypothetical protein